MNFWNGKPKLTIKQTDNRHDSFFGQVKQGHSDDYNCIAGAYINIINNSPVSITLGTVYLVIGKEKFDLIDRDNDYWNDVVFYFKDKDGRVTSDGSAIPYQDDGLMFPRKLDSYDTISGCVLFHNFPAKIRKRRRGKLVCNTAIGKVKKTLTLHEYNEVYSRYEYKDILQYERSRMVEVDI